MAYRKAIHMDLDAFATLFEPRSLGIHDTIQRNWLATDQSVEFELSKLSVWNGRVLQISSRYTFCGQHVRLVGGCPPCPQQFAAATEPSIYSVAFFSDVEHQVLPVASGYRVT